MLQGIDVIVLLYATRADALGTVRSIAGALDLPPASVQRSLDRLGKLPLFDAKRRRVNRSSADEFFAHALPFMFPPERGGETRGVPAAWGASPLVEQLAPGNGPTPVWPSPRGPVRGWALEPLHPSALEVAQRDRQLGEMLVLVDGIRAGDARVRKLSTRLLRERLASPAAAA